MMKLEYNQFYSYEQFAKINQQTSMQFDQYFERVYIHLKFRTFFKDNHRFDICKFKY